MLAYFETLCVDTGAANVLINSSLTILIVRMLRNARTPALRVRLASVLGLLVRHATYIADELVTTGEFIFISTCKERLATRMCALCEHAWLVPWPVAGGDLRTAARLGHCLGFEVQYMLPACGLCAGHACAQCNPHCSRASHLR